MKTTIILGLVLLLGVSTAFAGMRLIKGEQFAKVSVPNAIEDIYVSKVIDGKTTCYITTYGKFGVHAISCVK